MLNLTTNEIRLIKERGGEFLSNEGEVLEETTKIAELLNRQEADCEKHRVKIRFDKYSAKPSPVIKKLLREKGYEINKKSCGRYVAYMIYEKI